MWKRPRCRLLRASRPYEMDSDIGQHHPIRWGRGSFPHELNPSGENPRQRLISVCVVKSITFPARKGDGEGVVWGEGGPPIPTECRDIGECPSDVARGEVRSIGSELRTKTKKLVKAAVPARRWQRQHCSCKDSGVREEWSI